MHTKHSLALDLATIAQIDVVKKILEVVCRTTGMGFSAVARVTDKKWIACAVRDEIAFGLQPGGELELESTICHEIRQCGQPVAIDHVAVDATYCHHHTPKKYGFQSYISVPIILSNGSFFGTLCAIDPKPARVNNIEVLGMFALFADLIARHMDSQDRILATESALAQERKTAEFRDQFMAVLGHDLRNPLNAISSSVQLLKIAAPQNEDVVDAASIIQRSVTRMAELIDNVLDFARGTMGGGLSVHPVADPNVGRMLEDVIRELQVAWPSRKLIQEISLTQPVSCDRTRIAQVLSNLLANALIHGAPDQPIWIHAHTSNNVFTLSVTNRGPTIPPGILTHLFQPFARGEVRAGDKGLGLGLYIASEIARAHNGSLTATSADGTTCFTLRMPTA